MSLSASTKNALRLAISQSQIIKTASSSKLGSVRNEIVALTRSIDRMQKQSSLSNRNLQRLMSLKLRLRNRRNTHAKLLLEDWKYDNVTIEKQGSKELQTPMLHEMTNEAFVLLDCPTLVEDIYTHFLSLTLGCVFSGIYVLRGTT